MSDDVQPSDEPASKAANEDLQAPDLGPIQPEDDADEFLQFLVETINFTGSTGLGITLQMGGLLISGNVISGDKYFDRIAGIIYGGQSNVPKEELPFFEEYGDVYRQDRKTPSPSKLVLKYIHLEDCTIVDNHRVSAYSVLWRGRLSKIDGFFMGNFPVAGAAEGKAKD